MPTSALFGFMSWFGAMTVGGGDAKTTDFFPTPLGDLRISCITHATLMITWNGLVIHVDPQRESARLPKADLILLTHEHSDHLDTGAIAALKKDGTELIYSASCAGQLPGGTVMRNGDTREWRGIRIEAVPAYNLVHGPGPGKLYHPKGNGNGYLLTLGGKRLYLAGDTENIPEMKSLRNVDVAFLPMNLPYTMTPEMVADAARAFRPKILYPYHYGDTDPHRLVALLAGEMGIEVRIRSLR